MVALKALVGKLLDESTGPGELFGVIDQLDSKYGTLTMEPDFWSTNGNPKRLKEFVAAGGVGPLVRIAVTGWPADGNLAKSSHRYDTVTDVGDDAIEWEFDPLECERMGKKPGPKWRSPRRRAVQSLVNMAHYPPYMNEMDKAGLFAREALATMLETSLAHVDFSVHNQGWEYLYVKDQTQVVVVSLLNLASCAVRYNSSFLQQCVATTAMSMCNHYKDPYCRWVDKCHVQRESFAAQCRSQGWDEERVSKATSQMIDKQLQKEKSFGTDKYFFEMGGLDNNFCLFFKHFVPALQAAIESLRVDPAVFKSWCRLGDSMRAIGRWQMAHLSYTLARELDPSDEDLKARQEDARSHLSEVWAIDNVPAFDGYHNIDTTAIQWMRLTDRADIMRLCNPETSFDRFSSHSRFWAWTQMKRDMDDARAMAVATGLLPVAALPSSCARLKRPQQLPVANEMWQLSWTDMPMMHSKSGLARHMLIVFSIDDKSNRAMQATLGRPGFHAIKRALLSAMLNPQAGSGRPGRPQRIIVTFRLFPLMHKIVQLAKPWGIEVIAETRAEAQLNAKHQDTDWEGYNYRGVSYDEPEDRSLLKKVPDPNNGHKKV